LALQFFGQLREQLDAAWNFVPEQPLRGEGHDLLFRAALKRGHPQGAQLGSQKRVRDADDRHLHQQPAFHEHLLDLIRVDPVPADFQKAVFTAHDIKEPVRVPVADVPGVVAVRVQRLGRRLRVFPVALHDVRPACDQLPRLADLGFFPPEHSAP